MTPKVPLLSDQIRSDLFLHLGLEAAGVRPALLEGYADRAESLERQLERGVEGVVELVDEMRGRVKAWRDERLPSNDTEGKAWDAALQVAANWTEGWANKLAAQALRSQRASPTGEHICAAVAGDCVGCANYRMGFDAGSQRGVDDAMVERADAAFVAWPDDDRRGAIRAGLEAALGGGS